MSEAELSSECDFRDVYRGELEACCFYEYLRESDMLRRSFAPGVRKLVSLRISPAADGMIEVSPGNERLASMILSDSGLALPRGVNETARKALAFVLIKTGWHEAVKKEHAPPAWNALTAENKKEIGRCVKRCLQPKLKHPKWHPPLLVQEFLPGHDPVELEHRFENWKEQAYYSSAAGREYFFGLFRLDDTYNETEAVRAFRALFRKRRAKANRDLSTHGKTKGGGGGWRQWQAKLNDLVVMRLRKRFPGEKNLIKRIRYVAEQTTADFKGCKEYVKPRTDERPASENDRAVMGEEDVWLKRIEEISAELRIAKKREQRIRKAATQEMSRARADALKFFQSLFPDEKPLSY